MRFLFVAVVLLVVVWAVWSVFDWVTAPDFKPKLYYGPEHVKHPDIPQSVGERKAMVSQYRMYTVQHWVKEKEEPAREYYSTYHLDADTNELLTSSEVETRLRYSVWFFERHYRISEFLGMILVIGYIYGHLGGVGSVGVLSVTSAMNGVAQSYTVSRFFDTGTGGMSDTASNGAAAGCFAVSLFSLFALYYIFLSSPNVGKVFGGLLDFFPRAFWFLFTETT